MTPEPKYTIVIPANTDTIRVKRTRGKGKIEAMLLHFAFQDKETGQYVILVPSLDFTAYGETKEKANEMLNHSITTYLKELGRLPIKKFHAEIAKYGWKQNKIKHKEYSRVFVDGEGELNNFNAVENKIEVGITSI